MTEIDMLPAAHLIKVAAGEAGDVSYGRRDAVAELLRRLYTQEEPCTGWGGAVEDRLHALEGKVGELDDESDDLDERLGEIEDVVGEILEKLAVEEHAHLWERGDLLGYIGTNRDAVKAIRFFLGVPGNLWSDLVDYAFWEDDPPEDVTPILDRIEALEPETPPLEETERTCAHHPTRLAALELENGTPVCRECALATIGALRKQLETLANFVTGTVPARYIEEGSDVARIAMRHDDVRRIERREADDGR